MVEVKPHVQKSATSPAPLPRELSVGQVAARAGVSVSALHFYEREGLIQSERTRGNQRRYHRDVLRLIAVIRIAQRIGIPLRVVRDALGKLPRKRSPNRADWARLSAGWREDLDARITHLVELRDQLTGCIGCGCLSLAKCQLNNPRDALSAAGAGPRRLTVVE